MSKLCWRFFALLLALAATGTFAYAQNSTLSTQWAFSPVFFVPLENGVVAYQSNSRGAATLHSKPTDVATGNSNVIANQTLSGDSVLAGFAASIGTGFVAIGSNFGFADADGIGFADGAVIVGDVPASTTAIGSGSSSASVDSNTILDAKANGTSSANLTL